MTIRQINSEKGAGPDNTPSEALKPGMEAAAMMLHVLLRKILEENQGADRLERRTPRQDTRERRSEQMQKLQGHHTTVNTRESFQQSNAESDERFSRPQTSRSTGWIP
ncbi:unnamed protein product [Schistosoma mattheei]|uniref:Uncharacterized protein n=1 Tax=Schistosoma mattheei TaxID=31246 RepID=A0A183NYM1_9TREM|nr:unnamed protein product [Schistosoma mattheei]